VEIKIQVIIQLDGAENEQPVVEEIICLTREELRSETVGLNLLEAKEILASIQKTLVTQQVEQFIKQNQNCPVCNDLYAKKGEHNLVYRTLFGKLDLKSPRFYHCWCQKAKTKSFSPLAGLLPERTAPEFLYLQSKWAGLMSYSVTAKLLEEVLPFEKAISTATLSQTVQKVAERSESELGKEAVSFIEGCPL
jgi:hypothetical protein